MTETAEGAALSWRRARWPTVVVLLALAACVAAAVTLALPRAPLALVLDNRDPAAAEPMAAATTAAEPMTFMCDASDGLDVAGPPPGHAAAMEKALRLPGATAARLPTRLLAAYEEGWLARWRAVPRRRRATARPLALCALRWLPPGRWTRCRGGRQRRRTAAAIARATC